MIPLRLQTVPLQLFEIGVWISTQTSTKQLAITSVNSGFIKEDFYVLALVQYPMSLSNQLNVFFLSSGLMLHLSLNKMVRKIQTITRILKWRMEKKQRWTSTLFQIFIYVFLFLSVHNIEIKLVFGEFVIKHVLIIFDDFEERNEIQSVGRGTRKRCELL